MCGVVYSISPGDLVIDCFEIKFSRNTFHNFILFVHALRLLSLCLSLFFF